MTEALPGRPPREGDCDPPRHSRPAEHRPPRGGACAPQPGRVLALDIGSVRVGAALSDPRRLIAQGLGVWPVSGKDGGWRQRFEECLERYDPTLVLVGMPSRTDGSAGPEARRVAELVEELKAAHPEREFATWDERFTTVIAQRALLEAGVSRRGRRERVDKVAATLILQSWLERSQS
ncbi:MAG: Holliday junction resolvase RuvX [Fretibacterium sp.]|nr:Holliday junction resolvase RuvX [Fretibacterium sp.]